MYGVNSDETSNAIPNRKSESNSTMLQLQQMIRELQQTVSQQQEKMEKFYRETDQRSTTINTTKTEGIDKVKNTTAQVSTNGQTTIVTSKPNRPEKKTIIKCVTGGKYTQEVYK